jgi:hypothetical protein
MLVNDVKKGMQVQLRNGWMAELLDSKKGNIRMAKVYGDYTEVGSIYAKDILLVRVTRQDGTTDWEPVTLSPDQVKAAQNIAAWGF